MPALATRANASAAGFGFGGKKKKLPYRWVAVGEQGKMITSDSSTFATLTERTSSFGTTNIRGVQSNGTSMYVAVGHDGKLATSSDGITWTQQTSSFGTTWIYAIAYGNGVWVAVGDAGKLATSTDGTTWTQRTSSFGTSDIFCVAYGNGVWVAAGASNKLATATDPTGTWTQRTNTHNSTIEAVAYSAGLGIWVTGADSGTTGALQSATDPTGTWTARTSSQSLFSEEVVRLVAAPGRFILYAATTNRWIYSTNGTTWTTSTGMFSGGNGIGIAYDNIDTFGFMGNVVIFDSYWWQPAYSTNGTTSANAGIQSWDSNYDVYGLCHSSGTEATQ